MTNPKTGTSLKHALISKANTRILIAVAIAVVVMVFSIVATRSLVVQSLHRSKVISEKKLAATALKENDVQVGKLIESFKVFEGLPESVIGTTEKNSKVVLDALPPKYDFPALATSLEKILQDGGYTITSITGTDNEIGELDDNVSEPLPIEIPFTIAVTGTYEKLRLLPVDLERSIRPIHITSIEISGSISDARMAITAKTYYQPGKNLELQFKEVR